MTTDYIPIPHYTFYCTTWSHCAVGAGLEPTLWPWEFLNLRYSSLTFLSSCDYSFASLGPAIEVNFYICNIITQRTAFPVVVIIQMSGLLLNPGPSLSGAVTSSCQWNGLWRPVIYSLGWIWPGIFAHWVRGTKPKDIPSPVLSLHLCCYRSMRPQSSSSNIETFHLIIFHGTPPSFVWIRVALRAHCYSSPRN